MTSEDIKHQLIIMLYVRIEVSEDFLRYAFHTPVLHALNGPTEINDCFVSTPRPEK